MKKINEWEGNDEVDRAVEIYEAAMRATCDLYTEEIIAFYKNNVRETLLFRHRLWILDKNEYLTGGNTRDQEESIGSCMIPGIWCI